MNSSRRARIEALKDLACASSSLAAAWGQPDAKWSWRLRVECGKAFNEALERVQQIDIMGAEEE